MSMDEGSERVNVLEKRQVCWNFITMQLDPPSPSRLSQAKCVLRSMCSQSFNAVSQSWIPKEGTEIAVFAWLVNNYPELYSMLP